MEKKRIISGIKRETSPEDTNEYDGEEIAPHQVDCFPGVKERRKVLSRVMTRLYMYLHDLNWAGFDFYTTQLTSRYHRDADIKTLLAIYKSDRLRNSGDLAGAVSMFPEIERLLSRADSLDCLLVRYLTTKAFTLHFLGRQDQSLSLHGQAVQMGVVQTASNPTAYNLVMYALHCCLHRVGQDGASQIPDEADWRRAETYYSLGCQQHLVWTKDLDEDAKIPESVSASFFLFSFVRYIFSLVRSCVAGGFVNFHKYPCPAENLRKAIKCMEQVKAKEDILSIQTKFEFALVQCDYFIRISKNGSTNDRVNALNKAEKFAFKALSVTRQFVDRKRAAFYSTYLEPRLKHIDIQRSTFCNQSDRRFREHRFSSHQASRFSHMDSFSNSSTETNTLVEEERDFLQDLGHTESHFGTGSERHVAGCPQCALTQTVPKDDYILRLDLTENKTETSDTTPKEHVVNYDHIVREGERPDQNFVGHLEAGAFVEVSTESSPGFSSHELGLRQTSDSHRTQGGNISIPSEPDNGDTFVKY